MFSKQLVILTYILSRVQFGSLGLGLVSGLAECWRVVAGKDGQDGWAAGMLSSVSGSCPACTDAQQRRPLCMPCRVAGTSQHVSLAHVAAKARF